jgi:hypothetical protein
MFMLIPLGGLPDRVELVEEELIEPERRAARSRR